MKQDEFEERNLGERFVEMALLSILKETEGVVIEFEKEKFVVFKIDNEIYFQPMDDLHIYSDEELAPGSFIWMHKEGLPN
jgi:hypothetical protein